MMRDGNTPQPGFEEEKAPFLSKEEQDALATEKLLA
jgi:hypothetical protein